MPKVQEIAQSGHIGDNVSMDFLAKILTHDGQLFNLANNENYWIIDASLDFKSCRTYCSFLNKKSTNSAAEHYYFPTTPQAQTFKFGLNDNSRIISPFDDFTRYSRFQTFLASIQVDNFQLFGLQGL